MYEYKASLLAVIDGDTIDARLSLGFDIYQNHRLRLAGINTPELHDKDPAVRAKAQAAKAFVVKALPTGEGALTIRTDKDKSEKYGRYLATILVAGQAQSVNDALVAEGLAVPFMVDG